MNFDLRPVPLEQVRELCAQHHGYQSAGGLATYAFGVLESAGVNGSFQYDNYFSGRLVAGYTWQPPAPGASKSICPEAPHAVLMLSRMVAVPKAERELKHVSKPLMKQMKHEGTTWIQRWEHWVCERGYAKAWLETHGWERVEIPGKKWRSGNQAYRYERSA